MKNILITSIGFLPNLGGVETHLKDLIDELVKEKWQVNALTYQPLQTPVQGKWIEKNKSLIIYRLPVIRGLFYKLLKSPALEFLFLFPLLFLFMPLVLLANPKISVINAQGLIAGFVASIWSIFFRKKYVIATQSVYNFPKSGFYRRVATFIFKSADKILVISRDSGIEVEKLGIEKSKIIQFTHWEDIKAFKPVNKKIAKEKIGLRNEFIISFFGRLVEEKGVLILLEVVKKLPKNITLLIYGEGPLVNRVKESSEKLMNLKYMGTVRPQELPLHYSAADIVVMPSLHIEGFGRVAAGALLCSTPVIASDKGALPEVVSESVGIVVKPTSKNFADAINLLYKNKALLNRKTESSRPYAIKNFSSKNAEVIIKSFES